MSAIAVPKNARPDQADDDGLKITTHKAYKKTARTLRLIAAHLDLNQEQALELFERDFENYLAILEERSRKERKEREETRKTPPKK